MAQYAPDAMLDAALAYMAASDTLIICTSQPADYTAALAAALATVTLTPGDGNGDFTIADGDVSGRKVTVTTQSGITVDTGGSATHVALCLSSDSTLRLVTTCTSQALPVTGKVTVPAWRYELSDPGEFAISATLSVTLADSTFTAMGTSVHTGTLSAVLADDTLEAIGTLPVSATMSATLIDSTFTAQGTLGDAEATDATVTTNRGTPLMTSALELELTPVHNFIEPWKGTAATRQAAVDLMSTFPGAIYNQHTYGFGLHIINQYGLYEAFESGTQLAGKVSTSGTVTGETWASTGGTLAIADGKLAPTATGQATLNRNIGSTFTILANFNLGADGTSRSWNFHFRRSATTTYVYLRIRKLAGGSCTLEFWEWNAGATNLNPSGAAFATPLVADTAYTVRIYVAGIALKAQVWSEDQSTLLKEVTATSLLNQSEKTLGIHCPETPATGQWLDNYMAFEWIWSSFNQRMDLIQSCGGELAITGWNAPDWIKEEETYSPTSTFSSATEVVPKYYPVFAAWLLEIVRYAQGYGMMPHSLAVWNEMKGMWRPDLSSMDYERYSDMFSQVYDHIKPAYPTLPIGGPYYNCSQHHSASARDGAGGLDSSGVRFFKEIFTRVKVLHGSDLDYITFDGANIPWMDTFATTEEKLATVLANVERQAQWCAHIKELAALPVGDMSNPPTSLGGLGVTNKEVASKEHYIMSYGNLSDGRYGGMTHDFQAMAYALMIRAMILAGLEHAYHWSPEGEAGAQYDGNQQSLYRGMTSAGETGGQPYQLYYTYKILRENFYAGAPIYNALSNDADIVPVSNATHTLLIHKAQATKTVSVNGTIVTLGPEEVLLVAG